LTPDLSGGKENARHHPSKTSLHYRLISESFARSFLWKAVQISTILLAAAAVRLGKVDLKNRWLWSGAKGPFVTRFHHELFWVDGYCNDYLETVQCISAQGQRWWQYFRASRSFDESIDCQ
jgi:hypothetical protein